MRQFQYLGFPFYFFTTIAVAITSLCRVLSIGPSIIQKQTLRIITILVVVIISSLYNFVWSY